MTTTMRLVQIVMELWGAVIGIVAFVCVYASRKNEPELSSCLMKLFAAITVLMVFDAGAYYFRGNVSVLGYYAVRLCNIMVYALQYGVSLLMGIYIQVRIGKVGKDKNKGYQITALSAIMAIMALLLLANGFFGFFYDFTPDNCYYRGKYFYLTVIFSVVTVLILADLIYVHAETLPRMEVFSLSLFVLGPAIAMIYQYLFYGLSLLNIAMMIEVIVIFLTHEMEQSKLVAKQERQMQELEMGLLRSQIQPHFLFNSLFTIKALIKKDPEEATAAVEDFSRFLRAMLRSMDGHEGVCTVDEDLEIAEYYLSMEERRFGEELNVEYELDNVDFEIPYLTIQPLVENAVRHGIRQKEGGGTVTVRTRQDERSWYLEVEDDGAGFDENNMYRGEGAHIGLENIRKRVDKICGGELNIISERGKGTVISIRIPKQNA